MQNQLRTVDRSQARRKRWFTHYVQCAVINVFVTVIVVVPESILSHVPDRKFTSAIFTPAFARE